MQAAYLINNQPLQTTLHIKQVSIVFLYERTSSWTDSN
jgi:hypothetical protein